MDIKCYYERKKLLVVLNDISISKTVATSHNTINIKRYKYRIILMPQHYIAEYQILCPLLK